MQDLDPKSLAAPALEPTVAATAPKHSNTGLWIGLGVVALAVVAIAVFVVFDRNRQQPPPLQGQLPGPNLPGQPPAQIDQPNQPPDIAPLQQQFLKANDLISQDKLDQAQAELTQVAQNSEKLLNRNPDLPPEPRAALHTLAGESWLALDKPDRAQPHFDELSNQAPDKAEPLVGIALAHLLRGDLNLANETLDRAIRLNPDLSSAHFLKACVLIKQNERLRAMNELRQAGGPDVLVKAPPWMHPVLSRIDCAPDRFK